MIRKTLNSNLLVLGPRLELRMVVIQVQQKTMSRPVTMSLMSLLLDEFEEWKAPFEEFN
jgi:hypothetical protein